MFLIIDFVIAHNGKLTSLLKITLNRLIVQIHLLNSNTINNQETSITNKNNRALTSYQCTFKSLSEVSGVGGEG